MAYRALLLKHFLCDGPLQSGAMVRAKARYGHPLGLAHGLLHALGTGLVLGSAGAAAALAFLMAMADGVIHYHADYLKERAVRHMGWTPRGNAFWMVLAVDQGFHDLTYIAIAAVVIQGS